jgi:hypothetical protein
MVSRASRPLRSDGGPFDRRDVAVELRAPEPLGSPHRPPDLRAHDRHWCSSLEF